METTKTGHEFESPYIYSGELHFFFFSNFAYVYIFYRALSLQSERQRRKNRCYFITFDILCTKSIEEKKTRIGKWPGRGALTH